MINKLAYIQSLLIEANVVYWFDCGNLLKWYRDKEIDKSDIDFGVLLNNYSRIQDVLEKYKSNFEMIHYRDKEISLRYLGTKFDFICYAEKDDKISLYAYKQNPYCNNKWNYEWKATFPKDVYFPLKKLEVEHLTMPVPNNIEERLALQYGRDWQTPKNIPCWTYELNESKDVNYKPIAVIMTTIARDEILLKVLPSYLQYPVKLYLLDQGEETEIKNKYYDELRQQGHFIEYSHDDVGLSGARNYLLSKIEDEEYVFLTEDDVELQTNPYSLLNDFINNNLGILGGLLIRKPSDTEQHYEYELSLENKILEYKKSSNIDIVLNFFLAKAKVFKDIQWDDNLCLCEHTDFFYRLKQLNKWKVGYTRKLVGWHHAIKPETYKQLRGRAIQYLDIFMQKWGIDKIIKDNKIEHQHNELTVFVITHDGEPNLQNCLNTLEKQSIKFKIEIIQNYHPMSAAFQEMLNKCSTPYYLQLDSDIILYSDSVKTMLETIKASNSKECMVCFKLHDVHLNKSIDGVKIYKFDIFKNYPYNNVLACEMEQLERLEKDGFTYKRVPKVLGDHSPIWTKENIFERYFNYVEKYKKLESSDYTKLLQKLLDIYLQNQNIINLYAFIGGLASAVYPDKINIEKDYTVPLLSKFKYIEQAFAEYHTSEIATVSTIEKPLVLQISGIPCANRPYLTAQLLNKYSSKYQSRHILGSQYSKNHSDIPYREFPVDLLLKTDYDEIIKLIKKASVIHIHHRIDKILLSYIPASCKIVYTVSNIGSSKLVKDIPENIIFETQIKKLSHLITITDQPIQKQVYSYLTSRTVPLIPCLVDPMLSRTNKKPLIVFAPTNQKSDAFVSKGYYRVLGIIYKLILSGYNFDFDLIEGVPYQENIHRKQMADIVIDDVINEEFHNSSCEGGTLGAAVLTNYSDSKYPFIKTTIDTLENQLIKLITDKVYLRQEQDKMIRWAKEIYTPELICKEYDKLYDDVLLIEKPQPINTPIIISSHPIELDKSPQQILEILNNSSVEFWLINNSCLEAVRTKTLISSILQIGVESEKDKTTINELYQNSNLEIAIIPKPQTKHINLYNKNYNIPSPVVPYLENLYGYNWNTLTS